MALSNIPVIILAGGLGTRLRSVVSDMPKPMAPVKGKPFLHYLLTSLARQGIKDVILSVGYQWRVINEYFGSQYLGLSIQYSIESEPLGTGGGIKLAMNQVQSDAFILNGDTMFDIELEALYGFYYSKSALLALALQPMQEIERYGTVALNENSRITKFIEKQPLAHGLINGGVYVASSKLFAAIEGMNNKPLPDKFSFEKEVLESGVAALPYYGLIAQKGSYFIDIGIPSDYERAQQEMKG
jgi:D-glycero-alpha-D-manno-heptose 1-phosphate guanylyltransferase